ncbi:Ig-like domain-containing protein, partial [Pseudomonas sp. Lb2C1-1]|uniref:Ig-like domain-containing protein n=1 Tax=Pseudomonas TaxID=286 RepID=UPI00391B93C4
PTGDVTANSSDAAGNVSPDTVVAYADATAPTAPSVTVAANADGSLVVSGSAEPNSTVTVTYPDGSTATVVAGTDGSYSVT